LSLPEIGSDDPHVALVFSLIGLRIPSLKALAVAEDGSAATVSKESEEKKTSAGDDPVLESDSLQGSLLLRSSVQGSQSFGMINLPLWNLLKYVLHIRRS
jgi:hypothetical protein